MASPQIEPHKITRPIQLLAVWIAGLVLLVGSFLAASAKITNPSWLPALFGISAVLLVPLFVILIFVMQTRFRAQLQDDPYYSQWLKRREKSFENFKPENIIPGTNEIPPGSPEALPETRDLENWRLSRYEQNEGIFLVHTWRPSRTPGQVADIVIQLYQHGDGPLVCGHVKKVEYNLGPKFFKGPVIKTNQADKFRLEVSAYGPMLCVAKVYIQDRNNPIELERYINFEDAKESYNSEALRKLGVWCKSQNHGEPGTIIPDYLFSSSTHGEVAVSQVEEEFMVRKGWIELVEGKGVRITDKGRKAVFGTPQSV